jgi:hypothetical protein
MANIRRLVLDVDKAIAMPSIPQIAEAIERVSGVEALAIVVDEIDISTVGMVITIEGERLDFDALTKAIEHAGAAVHSIDELRSGNRMIEPAKRHR